jgi:hypothetical protein
MNKDVFWEIMAQPALNYALRLKGSKFPLTVREHMFEKFGDGSVIKLTDKWRWTDGLSNSAQMYIMVDLIEQVAVEPPDWPPDAAQFDEKTARWDEI